MLNLDFDEELRPIKTMDNLRIFAYILVNIW